MTALETRIKTNLPILNESQRRLYLASEAIALGKGGIKEVSKISGVHRNTISAGIKELNNPNRKIPEHVSNSTCLRQGFRRRRTFPAASKGFWLADK